MARGNGLLEGIVAGTNLAQTINGNLDARKRRDLEEQAQTLQDQQNKARLALELELEMRREALAQGLQGSSQDFQRGQALTAQDFQRELEAGRDTRAREMQKEGINATADRADKLSQAQLDRDRMLQGLILDKQLQVQKAGADYAAEKQGHQMQDQFDRFYTTKQQYQSELEAAQATGDPRAIAAATDKLNAWQQAGAVIFAQANKDNAIQYTIDPDTGATKIIGKAQSVADVNKMRQQIAPSENQNPMGAMLDAAIANKQKALGQNVVANPTGGATAFDYVPFVGGYKAQRAGIEAELNALQQQKQTLAPQQPQAVELGTGEPPAPTAAQTGANAFQKINAPAEGSTAVNRKTGQRLIYRGGAWEPLQ